ncbi:MAG TPA: multidrug efflux SMR transporter [Hyphomicrobium sp.]|jgi:quaternary ammonium compound-resistance protein SugE
MAWIYLLTAGTLEVVATTVFRYTEGLSRIVPTVSFFAIGLASFYFLNRSLSGIPLGTAYAVWTGIGAAGTAVLGILAYGEGATLVRVALLMGLVACIAGLKFVAEH